MLHIAHPAPHGAAKFVFHHQCLAPPAWGEGNSCSLAIQGHSWLGNRMSG